MTPAQLAERWGEAITVETLNNWRFKGQGPAYMKLGGRVIYPLEKVKEYEQTLFNSQQQKGKNDQQKNF
ncbi:DNA-binding protein (plasmid) [Roseomonas marmotae]|nr:DNA-binding protein [Roseomonas marmotae]